jgi:hypothetical protein
MDPDMPTYGEHWDEAVGSLLTRVAVDAPATRVGGRHGVQAQPMRDSIVKSEALSLVAGEATGVLADRSTLLEVGLPIVSRPGLVRIS